MVVVVSQPVYEDVSLAANKTVPGALAVQNQSSSATGSRPAGTLLSQVLLVPSAAPIVCVARAL